MGNTNATKRYTSFDHGGRVLGHTVQIGASSYGFTYEYNDLAVKTGETNRTYASGLTYAPHGAPDGGHVRAGMAGADTVFNLAADYPRTYNNRNVRSLTATRGMQNWVTTFGYDRLNRLTSASEAGSGAWSRTWAV